MIMESTVMSMPVIVNVIDRLVSKSDMEEVFTYLRQTDKRFSTYRDESETQKINRGEILEMDYSAEMRRVLALNKKTKSNTSGYFDIFYKGRLDPAGIVKGLAIYEGSKILKDKGFHDFYLEIAGDIQVQGFNEEGEKWQIGIEDPFSRGNLVKVVKLSNQGIATSGTYIRGKHIYNPIDQIYADEIVSITVIAPNVLEADRFATASFAMGKDGINFLESRKNLEGYMITKEKKAYFTKGFEQYVVLEKSYEKD